MLSSRLQQKGALRPVIKNHVFLYGFLSIVWKYFNYLKTYSIAVTGSIQIECFYCSTRKICEIITKDVKMSSIAKWYTAFLGLIGLMSLSIVPALFIPPYPVNFLIFCHVTESRTVVGMVVNCSMHK